MSEPKQYEDVDGILGLIATLRGGSLREELDEGLRKCVSSVRANGGKASVSIKLNLKLAQNFEDVIAIDDDAACKPAPAPKKASIMFATRKDGLVRSQEEQAELELTVAADPDKPSLREVK